MSRKHIGTLLIFLVAACAPFGLAQEEVPEQALDELRTAWVEGWNNADAATIAALYTEDADFMDAFGERSRGRSEIESALSEVLSGIYQGTTLSVEPTGMHCVKPTVCVLDSTWEVTGLSASEDAPPEGGTSTVIAVEQDGEWRIAVHRSRVPIPSQ